MVASNKSIFSERQTPHLSLKNIDTVVMKMYLSRRDKRFCSKNVRFFYRLTAHLGLGLYHFFVQYYTVIRRPSNHTVGRPRAENRGQDSNH